MPARHGAAVLLLLTILSPLLASCRPADEGKPAPGPDRPDTTAGDGAVSAVSLDGRILRARYLCDGIDKPELIAVLEPNAQGRLAVARFAKVGFGAPEVQTLTLGAPDAGADPAVHPLLRDGVPVGALEAPAAAALPVLHSVTLDGETARCRPAAGARFIGFTARRSVLVTPGAGGGATFAGFDFKAAPDAQSTAPSETLEGGRIDGDPRRWAFGSYRLSFGPASAELQTVGGEPRVEPFVGWAYAP